MASDEAVGPYRCGDWIGGVVVVQQSTLNIANAAYAAGRASVLSELHTKKQGRASVAMPDDVVALCEEAADDMLARQAVDHGSRMHDGEVGRCMALTDNCRKTTELIARLRQVGKGAKRG